MCTTGFRVAKRCSATRKRRFVLLIASCGIERWGQRAGELAEALRKHPVVVSHWVSEASRIRKEGRAFSDEVEALDQAMAKKANERLADLRAWEEESQGSFSWLRSGER